MNTETLIHNLALQCRPVRPIGNPTSRFLVWITSTIVFLIAGVWILRPVPELWSLVTNPSFIFPTLAMLTLSLISTLSAFILTIPDSRIRRFDALPLTVLIFWFALVAYMLATVDISDSRPGLLCIVRIAGLSLVPGGLLFYMLKKAAPMKSGLVGILASLGSLAFAAIAVQCLCPRSYDVTHVVVWHFMPVSVISVVGLLMGRLMFKWNTSGIINTLDNNVSDPE
jgi:hypothetical protein